MPDLDFYRHENNPDFRMAEGDHGTISRIGAEVNVACTRWLAARGLLASQLSPLLAAAQRNGVATRRKMFTQKSPRS